MIEEKSAELFAARGYEGTTLAEIAEACGVTKPIFYRHFESKKALYLELLGRHTQAMPRLLDRIPSEGPLEARFEAILDAFFEYVGERGYLWEMIFRDSTGDAEIKAFREEVKDRARAVLAMFIKAQPEAPVPEEEIEPLAEFVRTGAVGLALYAVDHPEVGREALVEVGMRVFAGLMATFAGATAGGVEK